MNTHCKCGGILKIKNHQRWIGYYCPSCKSGGSIPKKPGKWTGSKRPGRTLPLLTDTHARYETPGMKSEKTHAPTHIIKTSQLSWHRSSNVFIIEISEMKSLNIAPTKVAGKECFVIVSGKTNIKRNFLKDFDKRDAEGELQYTEYSNNVDKTLKLRVYND